nr:hypothetical protein BaRGS_009590 [Batillaria attramentaria]
MSDKANEDPVGVFYYWWHGEITHHTTQFSLVALLVAVAHRSIAVTTFINLQVRVLAWRVVLDAGFLRVCPIQPHFLRRICLATGSCPARSHSSSFRIFSGHRMLKMRLRQGGQREKGQYKYLAPAGIRTHDPSINSPTLYHSAIPALPRRGTEVQGGGLNVLFHHIG